MLADVATPRAVEEALRLGWFAGPLPGNGCWPKGPAACPVELDREVLLQPSTSSCTASPPSIPSCRTAVPPAPASSVPCKACPQAGTPLQQMENPRRGDCLQSTVLQTGICSKPTGSAGLPADTYGASCCPAG